MSLIERYQKLLELTRQEQKVIQESRYDELEGILKSKQETMDAIDGEGDPSKDSRREEILSLMQEIKRLGDANRQLLEEEMRSAREKLEKLSQGWQTLQKYAKVSQREATILDRRG